MTPNLVDIIGCNGVLADLVTDAFTELLQEPLREHSPHEFEKVEVIGIDGQPKEIKIFPREWIRRLEKAVRTGAFGRMSPSEIVEIILTTPNPEASC
jgi:hypothetical protein